MPGLCHWAVGETDEAKLALAGLSMRDQVHSSSNPVLESRSGGYPPLRQHPRVYTTKSSAAFRTEDSPMDPAASTLDKILRHASVF